MYNVPTHIRPMLALCWANVADVEPPHHCLNCGVVAHNSSRTIVVLILGSDSDSGPTFNPLNPHDALKYNFASLKNDLIT